MSGGKPHCRHSRIGIDFDNTIVRYDELMYEEAVERGLIDQDCGRSKRAIRDRIRLMPGGEKEWQKIQAAVYGRRMDEAQLNEGVSVFFRLCRDCRVRPFIVSHKTETARYDLTTNLRVAALSWMGTEGFFSQLGMAIAREDVYFESTRREKVKRIVQLRCTCFIDDLPEVFLESTFPDSVEKVLFSPDCGQDDSFEVDVITSDWGQIIEHVFEGADGRTA